MEIQSSQVGNYFASDNSQLKNGQNDVDLTQKADESKADKQNQPDNVVNLSASEQNKQDNVPKVEAERADTLSNEAEQTQIETALAQVSDFVQVQNRQLNFSFDEQSNRSIIKVTDADSGDTIRQIPSEEVLKLAQRIKELQTDAGEAIGVLVNRQV